MVIIHRRNHALNEFQEDEKVLIHHHFGAAVQWSRLATNADCIAVTVSSHRYELAPETSITGVNATSPMSIAIPTGDEATLALDIYTVVACPLIPSSSPPSPRPPPLS